MQQTQTELDRGFVSALNMFRAAVAERRELPPLRQERGRRRRVSEDSYEIYDNVDGGLPARQVTGNTPHRLVSTNSASDATPVQIEQRTIPRDRGSMTYGPQIDINGQELRETVGE